MTNIQVQYWDLQEKKRNNVESLEEAKRHNRATESLTKERNDNDYVLGQRNLDLGYLNSERNYEIGKENAAIGWQNSAYNYQLGMDRNAETSKHNTIMEGYAADSVFDYTLYGTQRGGDVLNNTVGTVGTIGRTVSDVYNTSGARDAVTSYRNWMSESDSKIGNWLSNAKDRVSSIFSNWGKGNQKSSSKLANNPLG